MTEAALRWVIPGLALLADWSVRWGVVIGILAVWLWIWPPRRPATRYALCLAVLFAGLFLPIVPRWLDAPAPAGWAWSASAGEPRPVRLEQPPAPPARVEVAPVTHADLHPAVSKPERIVSSTPSPAPVARAVVPAKRSPTTWQIVALAAADLWGGIVILLTARLACGRYVLARLRRSSALVGADSQHLLDDCRVALGLSRPVRLAWHAAIASPVTLGGRRPIILVPADWDTWPVASRRACLLHELAHLAHRDDWFKLVQELVGAPFFFHPLVRWLVIRLDRERELVCDDDVLALGADRLHYARLLVELARRPGRLLPDGLVYRLGWLSFLDRGTVAARVARLLEDDMPRTLARRSVPRRFVFAAVAALVTLGLGGLNVHVRAVEKPVDAKRAASPEPVARDEAVKPAATKQEPAQAPEAKAEEPSERIIEAEILDPDGKPVSGATVVAGLDGVGKPNHEVFRTDEKGHFRWKVPAGKYSPYLVIHKDGFAPTIWRLSYLARPEEKDVQQRRLGKSERFEAVVVDQNHNPVAGATARIAIIAHSSETTRPGGSTISTGYSHIRREVVDGSPLENLFAATTDENGSLVFEHLSPGSWLWLDLTDAGGKSLRLKPAKPASGLIGKLMDEAGFVQGPRGEASRLTAVPAAKVAGRVVTRLPGLSTAGMTVYFQGSRAKDAPHRDQSNFGRSLKVDGDGRFVIDNLNDGTINIIVRGPGEGSEWTYRAAQDVSIKLGETADVIIELIRGVEVQGKVIAQGTSEPVEGAELGVYGPYRPRSSSMTEGAKTDAQGRYHYLLPPGETFIYVMGPPPGFTRLPENGSSVTLTIPEGVTRYEVPPLRLAPAVAVRGRVLDAAGAPLAGATIEGLCEGNQCIPFPGTGAVTDARGEFRLPSTLSSLVAVGQTARLQIRLADGAEHQVTTLPTRDGVVIVKLPVLVKKPEQAESPQDVAPDELAGVVVDAQGKPIEGVEAHAWHWVPRHVTHTDKNGRFRFANLSKNDKAEVRFRKEGYETQFHLDKAVGEPGWVVVLGNTTYFEGRLLAPDGSPVAGATIRANSGPKRGQGFVLSERYTETTSGKEGRYRLYVEPEQYDIEVRAPGVGVARLPNEAIAADHVVAKDIKLAPGITFVVNFIDHQTGKPVEGVKLSHWQKPGIAGTSRADGRLEINDVAPGKYPRFEVEAKGYTRWWSDACLSEWNRYQKVSRNGFQRNFDALDFEITPEKCAVNVEIERGAAVRGRVFDPDGKPVPGATVAPALTGTGNSLTGDSRFSVPTDEQGRFTVVMPASGEREYNLVAHDGKLGQWHTWANGASAPFRTTPGQEIDDLELRLTRPAAVRGRVIDAQGHPVAGRQVRASAADKLENRYYDPTSTTADDGAYELKFIRPGEQLIQVAPFWLEANRAPEGTSVTLTLTQGQSKESVDFRIPGP